MYQILKVEHDEKTKFSLKNGVISPFDTGNNCMNLLAHGGKSDESAPGEVGNVVGAMVGAVVTVVTGCVGMTPDPGIRRPDTVAR